MLMSAQCLHVNMNVIIHLDHIIVRASQDILWKAIKKHVKVKRNISELLYYDKLTINELTCSSFINRKHYQT